MVWLTDAMPPMLLLPSGSSMSLIPSPHHHHYLTVPLCHPHRRAHAAPPSMLGDTQFRIKKPLTLVLILKSRLTLSIHQLLSDSFCLSYAKSSVRRTVGICCLLHTHLLNKRVFCNLQCQMHFLKSCLH